MFSFPSSFVNHLPLWPGDKNRLSQARQGRVVYYWWWTTATQFIMAQTFYLLPNVFHIYPTCTYALIIPILKKGEFDANVLTNYCPISNITLMAKTSECFIVKQLKQFIEENCINVIYHKCVPCAPQRRNCTRVDTQCHRFWLTVALFYSTDLRRLDIEIVW